MVQNAQRDYAKFSTVNAPYPTALHSLSSRSQSCSSWTAPLLGFFKMNVDAAVVDRHNRGVGVAIHNHHGQLVAAATSAISASHLVREAKAKYFFMGLHVAMKRGLLDVILESDTMHIVNTVLSTQISQDNCGLIISIVNFVCKALGIFKLPM
ncbi:hypothetical protein AHAS_Ahas14G0170500 [Arachis hypogaea]